MNYNTSAAPAEEVADQIKASGGDALVIGADVSKPEGVDKYDLAAVVPIKTGPDTSCSDHGQSHHHLRTFLGQHSMPPLHVHLYKHERYRQFVHPRTRCC